MDTPEEQAEMVRGRLIDLLQTMRLVEEEISRMWARGVMDISSRELGVATMKLQEAQMWVKVAMEGRR